MTSRDFCYWLQGLFELGKPSQLDAAQTEAVKKHLNMVFLHEIDPSAGPPERQVELNAAHEGKPAPSRPQPFLAPPSHDPFGPKIRC